MTAYDEALTEVEAAVAELTASVEHLRDVAEASGQGNPAVPLVLRDWESDLGKAIQRELTARDRVQLAWARVDATRPPLGN